MKSQISKKRRKETTTMARSQRIELAAEIYRLMMDGESDTDIIEILGISAQDFIIAKKFLLDSKGNEEEQMPSKERFAAYVIEQRRNIKDLSDLVTNLNGKTQYNAIVGALRLRADILDRIISTGQTLGIIAKEPEKKVVLGGVAVSEMKKKDLKAGVAKAFLGLKKMMQKYGEETNILDVPTGSLHYGESAGMLPADTDEPAALGAPPMKKSLEGKRNRAKTGKRSAGRRRVRDGE